MISYRINILNEKRDQNKKSSIPFQLKHFHVAFINSHFPIFARQMFILEKGQKKKNKNRQIGSLTGCEKTFPLFFQSFGIANCLMW